MPLLLRLVGIYELLCDDCNLLFTGFALPWTVPSRRVRRSRRPATGANRATK
ncbi:MAG: hypothetical protein JOZ52_03195 [Acidobacteria bacterium]|nr:hypothetical protein [Acidobacteriota bacterium]